MATYEHRIQSAIDATSVAKDAGQADDLRTTLVAELEEREIVTEDDAWLDHVVEGIKGDPNFMTSRKPDDFVAETETETD